jgi:hypothetical protein
MGNLSVTAKILPDAALAYGGKTFSLIFLPQEEKRFGMTQTDLYKLIRDVTGKQSGDGMHYNEIEAVAQKLAEKTGRECGEFIPMQADKYGAYVDGKWDPYGMKTNGYVMWFQSWFPPGFK